MGDQGHTPGLWKSFGPFVADKTSGEGRYFAAGDFNILPPISYAGPVAIVGGQANARLIAAAPDLLAVLKRIRNSYSGYIPDFIEAVDAAIARAESRPDGSSSPQDGGE